MPAAGYEISYLAVRGHRPAQPAARDGRASRGPARPSAAARGLLGAGRARTRCWAAAATSPGPVGLAAVARRTPLVLTEADSHLGLANRLLAPFARRVCLAFPIAGPRGRALPGHRPAGPARDRRGRPRHGARAARRAARRACVLVFGGSLGARSLNLAAVDALARLGCLRAAHHRPPRLRRGAARASATRSRTTGCSSTSTRSPTRSRPATWWSRARAARSSRSRRPGRPAILVPYPPRPPTTRPATRAGWRTPARPWCCADAELTAERLRARGATSCSATRSAWSRWPAASQVARAARRRRADRGRGAGRDRASAGGPPVGTGRGRSGPAGGCTSSASAAPGMSGLALIAQRARRRGVRLRPRRDAVLRRAARGGHRAGDRPRRLTRRARHRGRRLDRDPSRPAGGRGGRARAASIASCSSRRRGCGA